MTFSRLQAEDEVAAIKHFKDGIELFHKVAVAPHKAMHIAQESLRSCLSQAGNTLFITTF